MLILITRYICFEQIVRLFTYTAHSYEMAGGVGGGGGSSSSSKQQQQQQQ
jgi:hypothetical protein